jgi:hypothetical protein
MRPPLSFPLLALLGAALLAACGDSTGPKPTPNVTQRLAIVPASGTIAGLSGKSLAMAPGDSARLSAVVNASNGTSSPASGLQWSSSNTDVVGVDDAGVVRGKSLGSATVIARTTQYADTLSVVVSACGATLPLSLAVGQVQAYAAGQGSSICVVGAGSDEYVLVAFNTDQDQTRATNGVNASVNVLGNGIATIGGGAADLLAASGASFSRGFSRGFSPGVVPGFDVTSVVEPMRRDEGFDLALRARAEHELAPQMTAAREERQVRASRSAGVSYSLAAQAAQVPQVGQLVTLNAGMEPCDTTKSGALNRRVGRVAAVTDKAIVVADTLNPAGGFTDAEYQAFGVAFDTLAYPVDVANFGTETDIDKNGRSIIFFTSAVNALTPAHATYYVGGFFYERDLFPNNVPVKQGGCGASNDAEMFYMLVPDPTGKVNGNVFSKSFVNGVTVGTLGHEFQHLINAGRRLYVNDAPDWETTWLNEGLSHIAEELVFYKAAGVASHGRLDATTIKASATVKSAFNAYMATGNFSRLPTFLVTAETTSPYADNDELETRAATWQFLRYAADRVNGDDAALFKQLVATTKLRGLANLQAALGVSATALGDWFRDWATANFVDGYAAGLDPRFAYRSWNFRGTLGGLKNSNGTLAYPTYPILSRTLADGVAQTPSIRAGAAAYFRFAVGAGKTARLAVAGGGSSALSPNVVVSVVRTK